MCEFILYSTRQEDTQQTPDEIWLKCDAAMHGRSERRLAGGITLLCHVCPAVILFKYTIIKSNV